MLLKREKVKLCAGIICLSLAAVLMVWTVIASWPQRPSTDRYVSKHPAVTLAPLMGLSKDSLLNVGDADALDQLPGIGEVLAERIIEFRSEVGAFRLPEDLMMVKGIGEKKFVDIMEALNEPLVTLTDLE